MPTFTPPVVADVPWINDESRGLARKLFRFYGPLDRGRTVVKIAGVYLTVDMPDQLTLDMATEVYLGGHTYEVSQAVADALTAAGYGVTSYGGGLLTDESGNILRTENGDALVLDG